MLVTILFIMGFLLLAVPSGLSAAKSIALIGGKLF